MTALAVASIIPTYGRGPFLGATLASLARQTLLPCEVVVVDDGSPSPVSLPPCPLPLRILRIDHVGIPGARNAGLWATTAPLVHICDHDDLLEPTFYERMVDVFASRPSLDVVHSACGFIDGEGAVISGLLPGGPPDYATPANTLSTLLRINPIASVATLFRRQLAEGLHGFRDLDFVHDWDFWLRSASEHAQFAFVADLLAWHRVHGGQQSTKDRAPLILAEARRMLRSQRLPPGRWLKREQTIADLHLEEAAHHAAISGKRTAALENVILAAPARPRACVRAVARLFP